MKLFALTFILLGTVVFLIGISNRMRRATKGEKTTVGKVENFGLIENNKYFAYKYKAIIKSRLRKYEIESYSMPWLEKGEEVSIQMTGKQKILGKLSENVDSYYERLNNKAKVEMFIGVVLIVFPFVMLFAK